MLEGDHGENIHFTYLMQDQDSKVVFQSPRTEGELGEQGYLID